MSGVVSYRDDGYDLIEKIRKSSSFRNNEKTRMKSSKYWKKIRNVSQYFKPKPSKTYVIMVDRNERIVPVKQAGSGMQTQRHYERTIR